MQRLKQATVSVHSMIMLPRSGEGYTQVAVLPDNFDPKTQAVFLVDLAKDPQVWLEGHAGINRNVYLHESQPAWNNHWTTDEESFEGHRITNDECREEDFSPSWLEPSQVAHMVCIGFLKPEEEQPKQSNGCAGCGRELDASGSCDHCIGEIEDPEHIGSILEKYWPEFLEKYKANQAAKERWLENVTPKNVAPKSVEQWFVTEIGIGLA